MDIHIFKIIEPHRTDQCKKNAIWIAVYFIKTRILIQQSKVLQFSPHLIERLLNVP